MGDEQPDRYMSVPDLAWSRVNASEWAWKCSMFASAVPWPKSVHPEEGAEAIHRRLAQWLTDSQGATRLADDEDDQGTLPADSTVLQGEGGLINPQVQLGLAFFSNDPQQSPAGAEPGPACFPYHPFGLAKLLEDFSLDERKRLPC